jgi:hypothetical protein
MRYPASDKAEIIELVEQSHLPAKRTLDKLGIPRATFYRCDLSPEVHPAMGGILFSFEPVRLGDATGRGAEPSTQRSVPSCCIADAVSLA